MFLERCEIFGLSVAGWLFPGGILGLPAFGPSRGMPMFMLVSAVLVFGSPWDLLAPLWQWMPGFCFGPRGYPLLRWKDREPQGGSMEQPTAAFDALVCEPGWASPEIQVFFKTVLFQGEY